MVRFARIGVVLTLLTLLPGAGAWAGTAGPEAERFTLPKGELASTTHDITLADAVRKKSLELRVRIPSGRAPEAGWPLVLFSHGAGGSRTAFPDFLDYLASHGFASIAVTHADSIELKRRTDPTAPRELLTLEGREKLRRSVDPAQRVGDMKFVLDHLAEVSQHLVAAEAPALVVDPARIAAAGHSAGALTVQLLAGTRPRVPLSQAGIDGLVEPRIRAAMIISGQGTPLRFLGENSWLKIGVPILVLSGSQDFAPSGMGAETPESRTHPFTKSRGVAGGGPRAYLLYIEGATHSSYAGKATTALLSEAPQTDVRQIQDAVATSGLLFLRAHVLSDEGSASQLASTRPAEMIPGKVRWEWK